MLKILDINQIKDSKNVRFEEDNDLSTLADDIKKNGLITPIAVRRCGVKYEVVAGHRRLTALKMIGEQTVECNILEDCEGDMSLLQLSENIQRKQMTPLEIMEAIKPLKEKGRTIKQIAQKINKSESWVNQQFTAAKAIEREYGTIEDSPEEVKTAKSAANVLSQIRKKKEGGKKTIKCASATVTQQGHKYTVYFHNLEGEIAFIDFLKGLKA